MSIDEKLNTEIVLDKLDGTQGYNLDIDSIVLFSSNDPQCPV